MSNVVPIGPQGAFVRGTARCMNCRHEWQAIVPYLNRNELLECPDCTHVKGFFPCHINPPEEYQVLTCECENNLLFVLEDGVTVMCPACGEWFLIP